MKSPQLKDYISQYYSIYSNGNINEFNDPCADPEREINAYSHHVQAFSDLKLVSTNVITKGNQVVAEWEMKGFHINEFIVKSATN